MQPSFQISSYTEVSRKFELVLQWLGSLEVPISESRVQSYESVINLLATAQIAGDYSPFEAKHSNHDFLNTSFEISQLIGIHEGLADLNIPEIKSRLTKAVSGNTLYSKDQIRNSGRDFAFELFVASIFAKRGASIELEGLEDVRLSFLNQEAIIECKRPRSVYSVARNVDRALEQIEKRYEKLPTAYGIVALSIDKLLNPDLGQLIVDSAEEASIVAAAIVKTFIKSYEHLWMRPEVDHRNIGCIVVLSAPAYVKSSKLTLSVHQVGMSMSSSQLAPKNWWLRELMKGVKNES